MAAFPASLPSLDRLDPGVSVAPFDPVLRTAMDTGPAKTRPRFTMPDPGSWASVELGHGAYTFAQVEALLAFWQANAAISFTMSDPGSGDVVSWRFLEPPRYRAKGAGKWSVAVKLERMP
jgi:hypothetical protein